MRRRRIQDSLCLAMGPLAPTDLIPAGLIAVIGQLDVWAPDLTVGRVVGAQLVNSLGYLLAASALLWRRRAPLPVLAAVAAISSVQYLLVGASEGLGSFLPPLVAIYSVGRHSASLNLLLAAPLALLGTAVHDLRDPNVHWGASSVLFWGILASAWPVGQVLRRRDERSLKLAARAQHLEETRAEQARRAVAVERGRIARELHDIIGHAVGVIVVQAVAATGVLERGRPEEARIRLAAIEDTARQALGEMRRLVGLLDHTEEHSLMPPPSLAMLENLVAQVRQAGLEVNLTIEGGARPLPPGVELSAYRIVQEALTNVIKHAGSARVNVRVCYGADLLKLEIEDSGGGGVSSPNGTIESGRGLVGMSERVALYGGQFEAGVRPTGGYRVQATLPVAWPRP